MPSTYTSRLRLTKQATGEQLNTWGSIWNASGGSDLIDFAIAGVTTVALASTDVTLTSANGVADESRAAIIVMGGVLSGNVNVIIPNSNKSYTVYNGTTGAFTAGIKTSGGTAITIPQGTTQIVWCDAANVVRSASASAASDTAAGIIELATNAEAQTGTATDRAITPANLQAVTGTETRKGVLELATTAEAAVGTDTERAITAAGLKAAVLAIFFPIGSIISSNSATFNPNTDWGGTWVAYGTGRVLVGIDASQTEFDALDETGGAKTHTLLTAEMPAHTHVNFNDGAGQGGGGAANEAVRGSAISTVNATGSTGGGGAHNNMPPFIVVKFWRRSA